VKARLLAGGVLVLVATHVGLTIASHDLRQSFDGMLFAIVLAFCGVGYVVTRRQPANPIGWLLLASSFTFALEGASGAYAVLDYRTHAGGLPFGHAAIVGQVSWSLGVIFLGAAVIFFPNGAAPSPRWGRWLRVYSLVGAWFYCVYVVAQVVAQVPHAAKIDETGNFVGAAGHLTSLVGAMAWVSAPLIVAFWVSFVVHQARRWRREHGERREQLKWLMCGGAVSGVSAIVVVMTNQTAHDRVVTDVAALGVAALPLAIGVGILKYRLYEIDRLVSRTISYVLLTGVLASVFVGLVALTTDVLPFSSPVGVAASTLAAAVLFSPLRTRLQRIVDRRFNRTRYDTDSTVHAFAARLRQAVDLQTVEAGLSEAIAGAVEPEHVTVWLRKG
jgi:hypothetical protein